MFVELAYVTVTKLQNPMKSNILALGIVFAVFAALFALPVGAIAEGWNALMMLSILLVFLGDYPLTVKPLKYPSQIIAHEGKKAAPATLLRACTAAGEC
jgi:hypothetical protein